MYIFEKIHKIDYHYYSNQHNNVNMRISAKCDYACRALLELALHWPKPEPLQIHAVAESQAIPLRYLVQILIQLKQMKLVVSVRGKQGGYRLSAPPETIKLGQVIRAICGPLLPAATGVSPQKRPDVFKNIWNEVEGDIAKVLDQITFAEICEKTKILDKALTYHI